MSCQERHVEDARGAVTGLHRSGPGHPAARLLAALVLLIAWAVPSAAAAESVLEEISYSALAGNKIQLQLRFGGPAPEPRTFRIEQPARVVLDLPATTLDLAKASQTIGAGVARSVRAVEGQGRARVVLSLVRMAPYEVTRQGDSIFLQLEGGAGAAASTAKAPSAEGLRLDEVDFRRGEEGEGRVVVSLSDPAASVDMQAQGSRITVDFLAAAVPERLERRLDVLDFATPVKTVDTYAHNGDVRMVINTVAPFTHLAYQTGETFVVEVKPKTEKDVAEEKAKGPEYTGEKLSLNFQNIEVRAVLQLLADFTGLNIVTSDTVTGNITLRLKNVPWDQAMDIILKSKGLGKRQVGNVVMIAPAEEIAAREKQELEAKKQIKELAPLEHASIQVNYAKAGELAGLLKQKDNSLVSERGSVTIDPRTNKLLVRDTAENIDRIRGLVEELDIPVRQVLIESRIVLATDDFSRQLGVRFSIGHTIDENTAVTSGSPASRGLLAGGSGLPEGGGGYNVDLPTPEAPTGTVGLAFAELPLGTFLDLELSAAEAEGQTEIVSAPRVLTSNNEEASIEQGVEIPYSTVSNEGTQTQFKEAALKLVVTPQITPDDRIIMNLKVNKDSRGEDTPDGPAIDTQEVQTRVLVDNGETLVLGGIYERNERHQTNRVPFFGDLPVVGNLFRNRLRRDEKSELLIFVTPRIVKESASVD